MSHVVTDVACNLIQFFINLWGVEGKCWFKKASISLNRPPKKSPQLLSKTYIQNYWKKSCYTINICRIQNSNPNQDIPAKCNANSHFNPIPQHLRLFTGMEIEIWRKETEKFHREIIFFSFPFSNESLCDLICEMWIGMRLYNVPRINYSY